MASAGVLPPTAVRARGSLESVTGKLRIETAEAKAERLIAEESGLVQE